MKVQVQIAAWVAVTILLAGLSVTAIWQAQAISRLQGVTTRSRTEEVPSCRFQPFEPLSFGPSDSQRISELEQRAEEDRQYAEQQRRKDKADRELREWEERQRKPR